MPESEQRPRHRPDHHADEAAAPGEVHEPNPAVNEAVTVAATVGVVAAGVALFEVALLPGMVIGVAAMLAPKYVPKMSAALAPAVQCDGARCVEVRPQDPRDGGRGEGAGARHRGRGPCRGRNGESRRRPNLRKRDRRPKMKVKLQIAHQVPGRIRMTSVREGQSGAAGRYSENLQRHSRHRRGTGQSRKPAASSCATTPIGTTTSTPVLLIATSTTPATTRTQAALERDRCPREQDRGRGELPRRAFPGGQGGGRFLPPLGPARSSTPRATCST